MIKNRSYKAANKLQERNLKLVVLAGGYGTRLGDETLIRPKPMVEIGGKPILWHILKHYSNHGIKDFIICCGYKGYVIKEYFSNFLLHQSDVTFDFAGNKTEIHSSPAIDWRVTLIDTGESTNTGGRLKRISKLLEGEDAFCMTYGDGLSDLDISSNIAFHKSHNKLATVAAVSAPSRFGALTLNDDQQVTRFDEKPNKGISYINGGFFVLSPKALELIDGDGTMWEQEPMQRLAELKQLCAFRHDGFWHPMDTQRDKHYLESLWEKSEAPWKVWND